MTSRLVAHRETTAAGSSRHASASSAALAGPSVVSIPTSCRSICAPRNATASPARSRSTTKARTSGGIASSAATAYTTPSPSSSANRRCVGDSARYGIARSSAARTVGPASIMNPITPVRPMVEYAPMPAPSPGRSPSSANRLRITANS